MRLDADFFHRDCLDVAPELVGKILVRRFDGGERLRVRISETEAYRGQEDTACHAHKGRTKRTDLLYRKSGTIYVYLCYGIHWLVNIVTGEVDQPQAILLRAGIDCSGPGKLSKRLGIDGSFNGLDITDCAGLWIEDDGARFEILRDTRVGIAYADEVDRARLWRYKLGTQL